MYANPRHEAPRCFLRAVVRDRLVRRAEPLP
jgi:hypothetical protein